MKRSAIRCVADDAAHYLWVEGLPGNTFMLTIADLLEDEALTAAYAQNEAHGGYWLWHMLHHFFLQRHGGHASNLRTSYVLFDDSQYEPILSFTADGLCQLVDEQGKALTVTYAFGMMAQMIRLVLSDEPKADLGVLYAWLDVDEEI